MIPTFDEYISLLRDARIVGGFPLVAAGLGLMLFGWRMWKICVMLAFGLIGAVGAAYLSGPESNRWFFGAAGGLLLAMAAYQPAKYAVSLLGGIIAAGVAFIYLRSFNLETSTLWAIAGAVLIGGTAFASINRRHIVILVTAFLGAVLLISGLGTWVLAFPAFFNSVRYLAERSMIVIPFILLVPTVMSCFYQIAEVRRLQCEL